MSLSNSRLFDPNLNNRVVFGTPGPAGPPGPIGPPGPGSSPMTPFVEGIAFGETSAGRTLLGFGVDAGSNNLGLWASSVGAPQFASNSGMSITEFFDTNADGATMLNGVYIGTEGSLKGSNLSNSILLQRNSVVENQADWTENLLMLYDFFANPSDSIKRSTALMTGQFSTDSQFDQSLLIGDMTGVDAPGITDALCLRTPGSTSLLTMANNTGYIGNGQTTYVMNPSDFMIETYNSYFLKTLRSDNTTGQIAYYEPGSGELTYGPEPAPYVLPAKQPNVLGGQFGINSVANGSEVNGRNSFNNYSAGPAQLTGVTAVGQQLYQTSTPAANNFVNSIFLGRSHQFVNAGTIQNSLIAANITGNVGITGITDCNMVVPRGASLTLNYAGQVTGANFHSSGSVACVSDPLYSTVISSGGTVNPATSNLVVAENIPAGSINMSGTGNTIITSSGAAVTYNFPAGINDTTVIRSGTNAVTPTASTQLAVNHTTFLFPNLINAAAANSTYPVIFSQATGRISHCISTDMSRVLRRVGTTNASGQIVFSTGAITPPADAGYSITVVNTSTTVAYVGQVIAVAAASVTVQIFNSVNAVAASPTMTPSGAGIAVRFTMEY